MDNNCSHDAEEVFKLIFCASHGVLGRLNNGGGSVREVDGEGVVISMEEMEESIETIVSARVCLIDCKAHMDVPGI